MWKARRLYAPGGMDPTFTMLARRDKSKTESDHPLCKAGAESICAVRSLRFFLSPSLKNPFFSLKRDFYRFQASAPNKSYA